MSEADAESTVGEQRGGECGLCGEPLEDEWVDTFEGRAHPECDEQRAAEAAEAYDAE